MSDAEIRQEYLRLKRALFDKAYADLNDEQRAAVYTVDGPLLILAGAGSGKTTVLVRRISHIIRFGNAYESDYVPYGTDENTLKELQNALETLDAKTVDTKVLSRFASGAVEPYRVLAITFTNKAADTIKARLGRIFEGTDIRADDITAGTFHSFCARVLRRYGDRLGYTSSFTIYDDDDQKKLLAEIYDENGFDEKVLPIKSVLKVISGAKNKLLGPDGLAVTDDGDGRASRVAGIYEKYQLALRKSNAMDFDDLIMQTVILLKNHEDVRAYYQSRYLYISIDEYQDTNPAQFLLCQLLCNAQNNVMVVGDDDQSIYRFRGATIENILGFDKNYKNCRVIRLEQNYRSTGVILDAANAVIAKNVGRKGKTLWTQAGRGAPIRIEQAEDQLAEGKRCAEVIQAGVQDGNRYKDYAILYRTNAQSRALENALRYASIPYRVVGGTRFSDRKEIKDVVAYLQLIENPTDRVRLHRVINEPRRSIGKKTLEAVVTLAAAGNTDEFFIMENADRYTALERSAETLKNFAQTIRSLQALKDDTPLDVLYDLMLERTGYRQMLIDGEEEDEDRLNNVEEFKAGIREYINGHDEPTLRGFLEETALVADVDRYDETADAAVMMTVHSAKGLEFDHVLLPGMEEGLFPSSQSRDSLDPTALEEERRLCYVALTRAKKDLHIYYTHDRNLYGRTMLSVPSRFIADIPENLTVKKELTGGYGHHGGYGGYQGRQSYTSYASPKKRDYLSDLSDDDSLSPSKSNPFASRITQTPKPKAAPTAYFKAGDKVVSPLWGDGVIISVRPMGADMLYEIIFDTAGTKKIMASYAKLTKK